MQGTTDLSVSSRSSGRLVPEDDLKSERERWLQACMHEVWNMENAAFERINEQIEQATLRLQSEVSEAVLKQVEAERRERSAAIAELRQDLAAARSISESHVQARPSEGPLQAAQMQAGLSAVQAQMEQHRLQILTVEAAIADLRSEAALQRERQELQATSAVADLRQELSAMQVVNAQALQEQAARLSTDLSQGLRDVQGMLEAIHGPLKAELKQDVETFRSEMEVERRQVDELSTQVSALQGVGGGVSGQLEELGRRLAELRQDQLSETTMLRGRLEAVVGDRAETDTLQLVVKEERGRRTADVAALQARLDAVERLAAAGAAAGAASPARSGVVAAAGAVEGLQAEVAILRVRLEKAEALNQGPKLLADLQVLTRRLEQVEAAIGGGSVASASRAASEAAAMRSGLEALRGEVARLAQDLTDERRDRCRALSDVNRLAEDVAKAAAATIERAERRFAAEFQSEHWESFSNNSRRTLSGADDSSVSRVNAEASQTPSTSEDVRSALGTSMAKLVGEMDAELRVELTSRLRLVAAELRGEILSEVAVRLAAVEARAGAIETSVGAELQLKDRDLDARLGALEGLQAAPRLAALEEEAKTATRTLAVLLEERKKRAAGQAYDEIEAKCHHALAVGKSRGSSSDHREASSSLASPSTSKLISPETLAYAGQGQAFADCLKQSFEDGMKKSIDGMVASTRSPSASQHEGPKPASGLGGTARSLAAAARGGGGGASKHSSRSPDAFRSLPDGRLSSRLAAETPAALQRRDEAGAKPASELKSSRPDVGDTTSSTASVPRRGLLQHGVAREASSADPVNSSLRSSSGVAPLAASADPVMSAVRGAATELGTPGSPHGALRGRQPGPASPLQPSQVQRQPSAAQPLRQSSTAWAAASQTGASPSQGAARGSPVATTTPATVARTQQASTANSWSIFRGRAR